MELSKITGYIVCETFGIAPRTPQTESPTNKIDKALEMLQVWRMQLPPALKMHDDLCNPDPACCVLHMAYNQLIVLTTRPVFFAAVKQAVAKRLVYSCKPDELSSFSPQIQACPKAAHRNLVLAQRLIASQRKLLQAGLHFVFNATVILLLNQILCCTQDVKQIEPASANKPTLCAPDPYAPDIRRALRIFEEEARTGTNYPKDCSKVLQDLKVLTDRYLALECQVAAPRTTGPDSYVDPQTRSGNSQSVSLQFSQPMLLEGDDGYEKMMAWAQIGGLQLQESLFL